MSFSSPRIQCVNELEQPEELSVIKSLVQDGILALQAAAEKRVEGIGAMLREIDRATDVTQLENCELRVPVELTTFVSQFEEVADRFANHFEATEKNVIDRALESRLDDLVREERSRDVSGTETGHPSELVLRLRMFLETVEQRLPSAKIAKQKLVLARTALQALRSQQEGRDMNDVLYQLDQQEIEDLSPLVVDLALLVNRLKNPGGGSGAFASAGDVPTTSIVAQPSKPISKDPGTSVPPPEVSVDVFPFDPEAIARYQDDYEKHLGMFHTLRGTATTEAHMRELRDFEQLLNKRRTELSIWRKQGGYTGILPLFLADTFQGALPGESHVRGVSKKPQKGKKIKAAKGGGKRSKRKDRYKRRGSERGIPFNVWAEDSWGKDPDDTPRDRNVVLGGAMESNRSRH